MLYEESIWLGNQNRSLLQHEISPVLNVGSSTLHFRKVVQPHIQENIIPKWFSPYRVACIVLKKKA